KRLSSAVSKRSAGAMPWWASCTVSTAHCTTPARARHCSSSRSISGIPQVTFDDAAAEAAFSVVEHYVLARRERALQLLEVNAETCALALHPAVLVGLAVTRLCRAAPGQGGAFAVDPFEARDVEALRKEQRMFVALHDDQHIAFQI